MFRPVHWGRILVLTAVFVLPLLGAFAAPPAAAPPTSTIGVIDMSAIYNGYKGGDAMRERMNASLQVRKQIFDTLQAGLGLSAKDFALYTELAGNQVKVDKQRIENYQKQAKENSEKLAALRKKTEDKETLTADEQKLMTELETNEKDVTEILQTKGGSLEDELRQESEGYIAVLMKLIDGGVDKVSKEKKLTIVLNRDLIGSNNSKEKLVLWGGTDITEDVLKHLNDTFDKKVLDAPKEAPKNK